MALAGLVGSGAVFGSASAAAQSSCDQTLSGDLCMDGNSIQNIDDIFASNNYSSWGTSGTGSGNVQLFDNEEETFFMRASEDTGTSGPGPVEFQSSVRGPKASSPGVDQSGPFRVDDGAAVDTLSIEGHNRIDVVAESSIDHTGDLGGEIQSYINSQSTLNHVFVIPQGTYTWNTQVDASSFEFLGFVGAPQATLEITSHSPDFAFYLGNSSGDGRQVLLRNLSVDITASSDHDAGLVRTYPAEAGLLENLELVGQRHYNGPNPGGKYSCLVGTTEETGVSVIRNVTLADGGIEYDTLSHAIPFVADPNHEGTNIWEGCWAQGHGSAGYYPQNSPGFNLLVRCTAHSNAGHNMRLGYGDVARDCHIILEDTLNQYKTGVGLQLMGGTSGWANIREAAPPVAENVTIEASNAGNGLIETGVHSSSDEVGGVVRDTDVHVASDCSCYSMHISNAEQGVVFENLSIYDEQGTSPGYSIFAAADNIEFRDCDFHIPNRHGIAVADPVDNFELRDCTFHDTAVADVRFYDDGSRHTVVNNRFGNQVWWVGAELSEVLWTGNRHDGGFNEGDSSDWNVDNNWGFTVDVDTA